MNKRMKIVWEIVSAVAAAVAAVIAIVALTVSIVQYRYDIKGIDSAYQWKSTFSSGQSTSVISTTKHWTKGTVYYGYNQNTGLVNTQYTLYYKKTNGNWIVRNNNIIPRSNNIYYGEWLLHSTNGSAKYTYKIIKINSKQTKSTLNVDLMVQ